MGNHNNAVIKVFLVDDHGVMRMGLRQLLVRRGFDVCGEAETAEDALTRIGIVRPDVALVDLSLGRDDGMELLGRIRTSTPEVRLIVYSMHDDPIYVRRAVAAGAKGYVTKDDVSSHLVDAIKAVAIGQNFYSDSIAGKLVESIAGGDEPGAAASLSKREQSIYDMLGDGFSISEIADMLSLSRKTVETHCGNLKQKLTIKTMRELLRKAIQQKTGIRK
ncbi:MAG TPA: response regulator transcription factor [Candidatus Ozemobacteraceae bacterium]|nr:response regulator transcription factor [Candidatus Ozemobacteraceae bacterium]